MESSTTYQHVPAPGGLPPMKNATEPGAERVPNAEFAKLIRKKRTLGNFQSLKSGSVFYFDEAGRDFMSLLEMDPSVKFFTSRPNGIRYFDGDEWHEHEPDFLVERVDGARSIVDLARKRKVRPNTGTLTSIYAQKLIAYRLMTWAEIRLQPRLDACQYILRYKAVDVPESIKLDVVGVVSRQPGMALADLERQAFGDERGRRFVLSLAVRGHVSLDTSKPIGDNTPVWLAARGAT